MIKKEDVLKLLDLQNEILSPRRRKVAVTEKLYERGWVKMFNMGFSPSEIEAHLKW